MIPFAGYDPTEHARPRKGAEKAHRLFKAFGWDTMEIARHLDITEAKALRLVTIERSRVDGLPNPYGVSE